jgi:hypothetical protein
MPQLLREYYALCPDGACQIGLLTEEEKRMRANGDVLLTGQLQEADFKNANNRIYGYSVLKREADLYQKMIEEGRAVGELDHGQESELLLKNVSHVILRMWWEGKKLFGTLKILNTPNGLIAKSLVESKIPLGISSRALGGLKETPHGSIVDDSLQLICFDLVQNPSVTKAFLSLTESRKIQENVFTKSDRINRLFYELTGR